MIKKSFTLNALKSNKILAPLFSSINHSAVLPILEYGFIQKTGEDTLEFTTTDLENMLTLYAKAPATGDNFSFCLHGKRLRGILTNALEDNVTFEVLKDKCKITTGDFSLTCGTENPEVFPKKPILENTKSITLDSRELYIPLQNAIKFVSNDDLRPSMAGVCMIDWKGEIHIASTDAHRLYFKSIMKTPKELKGMSIILPKKGVSLFLQAFKAGQVKISFDDQRIEFRSDNTQLLSRLIDAKYPDFPTVIPINDLEFSMRRKQLSAFLKLAYPFVNRSTNQIIFSLDQNGISVKGGDLDYENYLDYKMPIYNINKAFTPFYFGVNLRFLQEIVSITKDEYCKFSHCGLPLKPMIIDDSSLLMPLIIHQ